MDLQPTLENDLVLVRPLTEGDFESLYAVAKDPLIWEQHPSFDRYQEDVFKAFFRDAMESKGAFMIIDKENGEVIGSSRYKRVDGAENAVEIGWTFLSRAYWGGAYNKSVKQLMLDYAFAFVDDVVFHIGTENLRSQKAVEKIGGLRATEPENSHLLKDDQNLTYRISKDNWIL